MPAVRPSDEPPLRRVRWPQACRIVPTRVPTIHLFERVADAADFDALYALEALTNDRIRDEVGAIERVPREQRVFGPGSAPIMAAFTHVPPQGSRFSDGGFGVFYAARERATAVAETRFHHARFLRATAEGPLHLPMRLYTLAIDARLHDLRPSAVAAPAASAATPVTAATPALAAPAPAAPPDLAAVLHPDDYGPARALGRRLRAGGSAGVVYPSVRAPGGQCVGLFKPNAARACLHAAYLLYEWDGQDFSGVYEKVA